MCLRDTCQDAHARTHTQSLGKGSVHGRATYKDNTVTCICSHCYNKFRVPGTPYSTVCSCLWIGSGRSWREPTQCTGRTPHRTTTGPVLRIKKKIVARATLSFHETSCYFFFEDKCCDKNVQFLSAEKPFNSELTVSYDLLVISNLCCSLVFHRRKQQQQKKIKEAKVGQSEFWSEVNWDFQNDI